MLERKLYLLWQGQLISQLGSQAYTIAMMYWLMANIASPSTISILMILSILPNILLSPIAGVLADRKSRKHIIIVCDLARGCAVSGLTYALFFHTASLDLIVTLFGCVALINGICKTFFQPAVDAWLPDLTTPEQLTKTVAVFSSSTQFASIIGQIFAGILYRYFGAPVLMLFDAASYFVAALFSCFIPKQANKERALPHDISNKYVRYWHDLKQGLLLVKSVQGMFLTMLLAASINFFLAPMMLMLPFYVKQQLHSDVLWYSLLLAGMALGSILGYWLGSTKFIQKCEKVKLIYAAMLVIALSILALSLTNISYQALLIMVLMGVAIALFNLQTITLFQLSVSSEMRGRIMSLLATMSISLLPLGLLLGGIMGELTHNNTATIFQLAGFSLLLLTVLFSFSSSVRYFISGAVNSTPSFNSN